MTDDSFQSNIESVSLEIHSPVFSVLSEYLVLGLSEVSENTENVSLGIHSPVFSSEHFAHQAESESLWKFDC